MIAPVDPVGLAALIADAGQWFAAVISKRKDKGEQRAALMLQEAGVLAAAVGTLDNQLYAAIAVFDRYEVEWTREQREEAFDNLNAFLRDFTTINVVRGSTTALKNMLNSQLLDPRFVGQVRPLLDYADSIVKVFHPRPILQLEVSRSSTGQDAVLEGDTVHIATWMPEFWQALRNPAPSYESVVRDKIATLREGVGPLREYVIQVQELFAKLKAQVLLRYPSMTPPTWAS